MNTFDVVLMVLLGLGALSGFQKGLITGASRLAGRIAAIGIAVGFHKQFLLALEPIFQIREKLEPKIAGFLTRIIDVQAVGGGQFGNAEAMIQPMVSDATIALTDYIMKILALIVLFFLVSLAVDIIITLLITPLARSLSFVNKGGGLAFGLLSSFIVLSLLIGMAAPLLTTVNPLDLRVGDSLLYPWFISGYQLISSFISVFAGDILTNPMEAFPFIPSTSI